MSRLTISPGFACRPSLDFSKIGRPSRETSNRPPPEGVSCTSAYKVITALYTSGGKTEGFKCTSGKFKVPKYTIPQQCTKPGKKIQFAGQGG